MHWQSHNKCAEVTHWLKKHVYILWEFSIFPEDSNHTVLLQKGDPGSTSCINLPPCFFKSDMNTFQCKLNVQVAGKSFSLIFDALVVYMSRYCRFQEKNNWSSSNPVQDQVTPFLKLRLLMCAILKRLETRVIKNRVFF